MAVQTPSPPPIVAPSAGPVGSPRPDQLPEETFQLAGWGRRLSAWLVDWIVLIVPLSVVGGLLSGPLGDSSGDGIGMLIGIVLFPVAFAYFSLLNGRGKSVGKWLLRISVVDAQTLAPVGAGKGAVRELVRLGLCSVSFGLLFLVDGLWPLWDKQDQSLHDKAAGSIVVRGPVPRLTEKA